MSAPAQRDLEARIAQSLDSGDLHAAATVAVRGYGPQILGYLVTVTHDEELAHEVFSQFCEALWRGIGRYRRECAMRTWAYKIAWTLSKDAQRAAFRRRERRLETTEFSKLADEVRSSLPAFQKSEVVDRLHKLRAELDPAEQTLLTLRIDKGMAWKDVARVFADDEDMGEAALRKRFERLKSKLRRLAADEGLLR